jgi:hypothetical protein
MTVYKVKLVSQKNSIVLLICFLICFFGILKLLSNTFIGHHYIKFILFIFLGVTLLSWQLFVTGRSEWTLDDDMVMIHWTKPFTLSDDRDDTIIIWSDIEKIYQGPDPHYYTLKIRLFNGQIVKFYHDYLTTRDEFNQLIAALNEKMKLTEGERLAVIANK